MSLKTLRQANLRPAKRQTWSQCHAVTTLRDCMIGQFNCHRKKLKSSSKPVGFAPPPPEKKVVSAAGGPALNRGITSTLYPSKLYLYGMYNDLTIRNGRLVNNRPNDVTGIQQAIQIKKDMKREKKISMMAEAIYRGEAMSDLEKSMKLGRKY